LGTRVLEVIPGDVFIIRYIDRNNAEKTQLCLMMGEGKGSRSFFNFPKDLTLDMVPMHPRMGRQVANLLDGVVDGEDEEMLDIGGPDGEVDEAELEDTLHGQL